MATAHEIARELLAGPDEKVFISVDLDDNDNSGHRLFAFNYNGLNPTFSDSSIGMMFDGYDLNADILIPAEIFEEFLAKSTYMQLKNLLLEKDQPILINLKNAARSYNHK